MAFCRAPSVLGSSLRIEVLLRDQASRAHFDPPSCAVRKPSPAASGGDAAERRQQSAAGDPGIGAGIRAPLFKSLDAWNCTAHSPDQVGEHPLPQTRKTRVIPSGQPVAATLERRAGDCETSAAAIRRVRPKPKAMPQETRHVRLQDPAFASAVRTRRSRRRLHTRARRGAST